MDDLFKVALAILMMTGFPLITYAGFVGIRVWQRKIERGNAGGSEEIEELRARIAELERMQGRVDELEERMDFSERLLVQDKQSGQLKP
jgi:hypothetical protein